MKNVITGGLILAISSLVGMIIGLKVIRVSEKLSDSVTAFAAGAMLATATFGLIAEALELTGAVTVTAAIMLGMAFIIFSAHLAHRLQDKTDLLKDNRMQKVMLFVLSVAIHHFPEGLATGISYKTQNIVSAFSLAGGIALHNLPEAMIIVIMLLEAGMERKKTVMISLSMVAVQFVSTLSGYGMVSLAAQLVPAGLAFAAGTILLSSSMTSFRKSMKTVMENWPASCSWSASVWSCWWKRSYEDGC